jgi:hypothetical protein
MTARQDVDLVQAAGRITKGAAVFAVEMHFVGPQLPAREASPPATTYARDQNLSWYGP